MPFQFLANDPFMGRPGLSNPGWQRLAGSVIDIDFRAGKVYGLALSDIIANAGTLKITGAGLQVLTGDAIVTTAPAVLAALNAATTVIRTQFITPATQSTTGSNEGILRAQSGANYTLVQRFRASPNQLGPAASHAAAGANVASFAALGTTFTGDGQRAVIASRHRTTSASISCNGSAVASASPAGKSAAVDTLQFGLNEPAVGLKYLNSYIERVTIWTDDPTDTELRSRST